jgi:hypothetical protein
MGNQVEQNLNRIMTQINRFETDFEEARHARAK